MKTSEQNNQSKNNSRSENSSQAENDSQSKSNSMNRPVHLQIGYQLDQYELESLVNIGDFRITYYAWDNLNDRNVIIQEYFPKSLAMRGDDGVSVTSESSKRISDFEFGLSEFLLEARLISQIHSAYLPHVVEYREANGTSYLISEFDDGKSLRELLDEGDAKLSDAQLTEIFKSALQGLRELHARNLLHTSVCPENLYIRSHGHPLLLGQGLARYRLAQHTNIYTVSLEPGYTPLEQYGLDGNIGAWSDLYALGACLYECLTGARPIDASARHTALIKCDEDPLPPAVEVGKGEYSHLLLSNIDWMLKPYIEDRPDSADLMLGIINFQKQRENSRPVASYAANSELLDAQQQLKSWSQSNSELDNKEADQEQLAALEQLKSGQSGRWIYSLLAVMFMGFLALTGYQIYQHEIKQSPPISPQVDDIPEIELTEESEKISDVEFELEPKSDTEDRNISRENDDQRREFYQQLAQQEEVDRRVEEEIQAITQEQQAQQEEQAQQQQAQIDRLLRRARRAQQQQDLISPQGNSAYDYYRQVLQLSPGNPQAIAAINAMADDYFSNAEQALQAADPRAANQLLSNLIKVKPDDERIGDFLQKITDLKADIQLEQEKKRLQQVISEIESQQQPANENKTEPATQNSQPNQQSAEPQQVVTGEASPTSQAGQQLPVVEEASLGVKKGVTKATTKENTEEGGDQQTPVSEPQGQEIDRNRLNRAYQSYDSGRYSKQLFDTIFQAAQADDTRSQYILAEMYAAGRGTDQNFAESTFWLKKSLERVNQNARYRQPWAEKALGVIYEKGWYVSPDSARAVRWYKSSARKDYAPAQYRLGLAYAKGIGVKKDVVKAETWLRKALSNGHQEAKKALSKLPVQN